jgi:flagellar hook-length control protein FliK
MSHAPDGTQRLTMKLEPPELGQVQIRIDRPVDAPAQVAITVERPETLQLLLRDQPQLQHALDLAGVPAEGRSVTFHVATPEPSARTETAMAPTPTGSSAAMGGDLSHGASRQGGHPAQPGTQTDTSGTTDDNDDFEATAVTPTNWLRAGLDITA